MKQIITDYTNFASHVIVLFEAAPIDDHHLHFHGSEPSLDRQLTKAERGSMHAPLACRRQIGKGRRKHRHSETRSADLGGW